jgi:DNA-directed RNA polymerase specialized sigma24 family protein
MAERLDEGSITRWLGVLRVARAASPTAEGAEESVEEAVRALWGRYFRRMVGLARLKLEVSRARDAAVDGEDIALSAFESFCGGAARGRFPDLFDRDDLWRLLVVITSRKALSESRRRNRQKRGAGLVRNESDLGSADLDEDDLLAQAVGTEPTPESAAIVVDRLDDDTLRQVAVWRMEGYGSDEIAAKLGCAKRTVARQLALIRTIWRADFSDDLAPDDLG